MMILQIWDENIFDSSSTEQSKPPHGGDHRACETPNPPWWCDNAPPASIDSAAFLLLAGLVIIMILTKFRNKLF